MDLTSNEPFWLVKNGLLNTYPSLKEDMDTPSQSPQVTKSENLINSTTPQA